MAKLKPTKSADPAQNDEEVKQTTTTPEGSDNNDNQNDQKGGLDDVLDKAKKSADGAAESEGQDDPSDNDHDDSGDDHSQDNDAGENPETAPPDPKDEDGITVTTPKPSTPKATQVKVATVCDHSCYIGGKAYHFKAGEPTYVPQPVKQILQNAGLLKAI